MPEETNDPILRKFIDGRTDRQTRVISVITLSDRRRASNSVLWNKKTKLAPRFHSTKLDQFKKTNN